MANDDTATGIDGYLFRLIATFEAAAMQQMGKIAHPITGDVDVDLDGARDSVEMLDMVRRKTEGNLNEDESRLLEHVLYQLRMNYVDVSREQGDAEASSDETSDPKPEVAKGRAAETPDSADSDKAGGEEETAA